jgi:hypothetical protein
LYRDDSLRATVLQYWQSDVLQLLVYGTSITKTSVTIQITSGAIYPSEVISVFGRIVKKLA